MITSKTRRGFALLVVLAAVSMWAARENVDKETQPHADVDPNFDYVLRDFELQFFDENGLPTLNLKAPLLRNDPDMKLGTIEQPVVKVYQPGVVWDLTAEVATVTADKENVSLGGIVNINRQQIDTGKLTRLNTADVQIKVTPQTASTEKMVEVFDGFNQISGIGLDMDMKADTFVLKKQVKATYAVN
jgi:LPS export ABC transporter protein LptC